MLPCTAKDLLLWKFCMLKFQTGEISVTPISAGSCSSGVRSETSAVFKGKGFP